MNDLRKAAQAVVDIWDVGAIEQQDVDALRAALAQPDPVEVREGWEYMRKKGLLRKPLTEDELETAYRAIWRNLPEDFNYGAYGWIEQGIRYAEQTMEKHYE